MLVKKKQFILKLFLNVCKSLFYKSNQELNSVPDRNAEEVVILSLSDVYADQPPAIPRMLYNFFFFFL